MAHPYATLQQVLDAFPPALTALGVGSFNVSTTQVQSYYIFAAQGVVDGYLANRYETPVNSVSALVTKVTVDLVIYELFRDRGLRVPDFMNDRYTQASDMLKEMAKGTIKVPGATEVTTGDNFAYSTGAGYHPVFSPVLNDIDQSVDNDYVQAELDDRTDDWSDVSTS